MSGLVADIRIFGGSGLYRFLDDVEEHEPISEPVWNRVLALWFWDLGIRWAP